MKKQSDKDDKIAELQATIHGVFCQFTPSQLIERLVFLKGEDVCRLQRNIEDETAFIKYGSGGDKQESRKYIKTLQVIKKQHQKILTQLKKLSKDMKKVKEY